MTQGKVSIYFLYNALRLYHLTLILAINQKQGYFLVCEFSGLNVCNWLYMLAVLAKNIKQSRLIIIDNDYLKNYILQKTIVAWPVNSRRPMNITVYKGLMVYYKWLWLKIININFLIFVRILYIHRERERWREGEREREG